MDRVLDELGRVVVDPDLDALGELFAQLLQLRADRVSELDGVGAALLLDAEADGGLPVDARDASDVGQALLDVRDVRDAHRLPHDPAAADPLRDRDAAELADRGRLAHHADVVLQFGGLQHPAGELRVLGLDRVDHVVDGDLQVAHLLALEPDAQVRVGEAHQRDLARPGQGLEAVHETVPDVGGQLAVRPGARDAHEHDRMVLGVDLLDDRSVHLLGQVALGLGDLGLHLLHGDVDVLLEVELRGDVGRAETGRGADLADALDRHQGFLDRVDDLVLHDLGRGPLPGQAHVDHRRIHVGILRHAEPEERQASEQQEAEHDHPGKDRLLDGDVREGHLRISSGRTPAAVSRAMAASRVETRAVLRARFAMLRRSRDWSTSIEVTRPRRSSTVCSL